MAEFNLSEKIRVKHEQNGFIMTNDVKEFIKKLKEGNVWTNGNDEEILSIGLIEFNKLAGDDLNGK